MVTQNSNAWFLYHTDDPIYAIQGYRRSSNWEYDFISTYQWDNFVPNYEKLKAGDFIAIWDGQNSVLLGVSVVTEIIQGEATKIRFRCPYCKASKVMPRKTTLPRYRCGNCKNTFEKPFEQSINVKTYTSDHAAGWVDLSHLQIGNEFKELLEKPKSQHSLRRLDTNSFQNFLKQNTLGKKFNFIHKVQKAITGGSKIVTVKTRVGQPQFRKQLIEKYGFSCAISGPSPKEAIHACHLYSYAKHEEHEAGILLRSDLHSLFDSGLLKINPDSQLIVIDSELEKYPLYWDLNGTSVNIELTTNQKRWLKIHWEQYTSDDET
ncbi:MAG: hypothetical protein CL795_02155 [Chloroflexi bacterium]|nr:hypothetical protein [Chloroflexota bacterium]|tara:strand:+ start:202 stop:1161 length:960 start_codon:yes stop_codon:yes gene_type:complete